MALQLVAAASRGGRENGQRGILAPSGLWAWGSRSLSAQLAYLLRVVPSRPLSITSVTFTVTTAAGSDDPVEIGLYLPSDSNLERTATSGIATGKLNTLGVKSVPLVANLAADSAVYIAFVCGSIGSTAATVAGASFGSAENATLFGVAPGVFEAGSKSASYPLPATIVAPTAGGLGSVPAVALREA